MISVTFLTWSVSIGPAGPPVAAGVGEALCPAPQESWERPGFSHPLVPKGLYSPGTFNLTTRVAPVITSAFYSITMQIKLSEDVISEKCEPCLSYTVSETFARREKTSTELLHLIPHFSLKPIGKSMNI